MISALIQFAFFLLALAFGFIAVMDSPSRSDVAFAALFAIACGGLGSRLAAIWREYKITQHVKANGTTQEKET